MAKMTKTQMRKAKFREEVYRILRAYQERQKHPAPDKSGTIVGHLDIALTEVFDGVNAAFDKLAAPPSREGR